MKRRAAVLVVLLLAGAVARAQEPQTPTAPLRTRLSEIAKRGEWNALLTAADRALATSPSEIPAWEFRAYALHKMNRIPEARDSYARVTQLDKSHAWAWTQLGMLHLELDAADEARAALERAIEIDPRSTDASRKLCRVLRQGRDWEGALAVAARVENAGLDPAWSALESGYLEWARGEPEKALGWLNRAEQRRADGEECNALRRLVKTDLSRSPEVRARCRRGGAPWTFNVGAVEVETRAGPDLPPEFVRELEWAIRRFPEFLGVPAIHAGEVKIVLSRTIEEHEDVRRRAMPGRGFGRAFTERGGGAALGREFGTTGNRNLSVIHASWSRPQLERTMRHEMVHAILYRDTKAAIPPWLDEGLATYLETWADGTVRGEVRTDVVSALAEAHAGGRLPSMSDVLRLQGWQLEGDQGFLRYATCWSVVRFLAEDSAGGGLERLRKLRARSWDPASPERALRKVYGDDVQELESAWTRHVANLAEVAGR